jgi:hypothetical protein
MIADMGLSEPRSSGSGQLPLRRQKQPLPDGRGSQSRTIHYG